MVIPFTNCTLDSSRKANELTENTSEYYVIGTYNYTKYLVSETSNYNKLKSANISLKKYFTSVIVAKWPLNEHGITIFRVMRQERKKKPKELKATEEKE